MWFSFAGPLRNETVLQSALTRAYLITSYPALSASAMERWSGGHIACTLHADRTSASSLAASCRKASQMLQARPPFVVARPKGLSIV
jgi:hypothetical protein